MVKSSRRLSSGNRWNSSSRTQSCPRTVTKLCLRRAAGIPNNKVTLTPRCSRRRWSGVSRTRFRFQPLFMRRAAGLSNSCDSRERPSAIRKGACTTQPRGRTKKFTYRLEHDETDPKDFEALVSTNLLGFLYITQRTVKEMLKRNQGAW